MNYRHRNKLLAFRTTENFSWQFEALCDRLGVNKSVVARYAIGKFLAAHVNDPDNFTRLRGELI